MSSIVSGKSALRLQQKLERPHLRHHLPGLQVGRQLRQLIQEGTRPEIDRILLAGLAVLRRLLQELQYLPRLGLGLQVRLQGLQELLLLGHGRHEHSETFVILNVAQEVHIPSR